MYGKKTVCKLQKITETQDDYGGWPKSPVIIAEFKGVFSTLSERERLVSDTLQIQSTHRLRISTKALSSSNLDELTPESRIKIGDTVYQITAVIGHLEGPGKHYEVNMRLVE